MNKLLPVLLFDWDGTVVDSNAWKWGGAWQEVFADEPELLVIIERILTDDREKKLSRGQLVEEIFRQAIERRITPHASKEEYITRFGREVRKGIVRVGLLPGTKELLALLHVAGHRMYVISATAQEDLTYTATALGVSPYFVALYGRPREKEEHARIIQKSEPPNAQFFVIGDGASDRHLAEYLNCPFVGVMNEWNDWARDETLVYKIINLQQLPALLTSL